MFQTVYTYKIALFPVPTVFISAITEIPKELTRPALQSMMHNLIALIEVAKSKYNAIMIANEPTSSTHNLDFKNTINAVALYCSLRFTNVIEMNKFLSNEIAQDK